MQSDRFPRVRVSSPTAPALVLQPGRPVSIGRSADMIISNDPFLHRTALSVELTEAGVVLGNIGSSLRATVVHERSRTTTLLEAGGRCGVFEGRTTVTMRTSNRTHEIRIDVTPAAAEPAPVTAALPRAGADTRTPRALTDDQRLLLTALAEPFLLDPSRPLAELPTNAELARRVAAGSGINGRLDRLCGAVARMGVDGLEPVVRDDESPGTAEGGPRRRSRRRERLVEWALENRVVTVEDIDRLDEIGQRGR